MCKGRASLKILICYNFSAMILITGGTGFIGNALVRHLSQLGYPVKLLLRPSKESPNIPHGLAVDVAVASLDDDQGLRAAMKDVDTIFHLASAESLGRKAELSRVDIQGTQALLRAATQSSIDRFYFLSHLGADRASAYPLLKAKAIAEHHIRTSGLPYTIIRSALAYGEGDRFTNGLAFLLKVSPYFVMMPSEGSSFLQPIWVEDLVTVLAWSLDMPETINQTYEVGGPEYLSFREIASLIADRIKIRRRFIGVPSIFLTILTELLEIVTPTFPTSVFWMDTLAADRTTSLDVLPRVFNLLPSQMGQRLGYLEGKSFRRNWWKIITQRKRIPPKWH